MFKIYVFKGGIYRHDEVIEEIEDLGGIILQKMPMQTEIDIVFALEEPDIEHLEKLTKKLRGEVIDIPFGDMEIAIVAPSLSRHHLPHPVCDLSEFLRRYGSTTNIIGLARGYGKTIFQISDKEKRIISEHDAAIFSYGMFEECILIKEKEVRDFTIPYVLCGGPSRIDGIRNYIGDIGRKPGRMKSSEDIKTLERVKNLLLEMVEKKREDISNDPLMLPPVYVKRALEDELGLEGTLGDNPIVLHLDGVRVKKPFNDLSIKVADSIIGGHRLGDIARITRSNMNDTIIVKMRTKSEMGVGA